MTTKLWQFWILLLLATWNNIGLLWRWMENSGMMQVVGRPSCGATGSQNTWQVRGNSPEHRECSIVCCMLQSWWVTFWLQVLSLPKASYHWFRGEQNMTSMILWPTELITFVRNSAFPLHDVSMRWTYGKFSTTVLRHLLIKVANIIFLCPRLPLCCL